MCRLAWLKEESSRLSGRQTVAWAKRGNVSPNSSRLFSSRKMGETSLKQGENQGISSSPNRVL
ncbi:UNVERIFIED_CONTAM: hypothetical protein Sangu_2364900 [Sesamum angustifolium]|uniref:Uncharacterized protein n=1 Tax=Sesamum angustifolium TaxID=2727405 RepID=A0AAW2KXD7_9LAMI